MLDGEKVLVPIKKVIQLSDGTTQTYSAVTWWGVTAGGAQAIRRQIFNFEIDLPLPLLLKISEAKKVEGSLRETFVIGTFDYEVGMARFYKEQLREFLRLYNQQTGSADEIMVKK